MIKSRRRRRRKALRTCRARARVLPPSVVLRVAFPRRRVGEVAAVGGGAAAAAEAGAPSAAAAAVRLRTSAFCCSVGGRPSSLGVALSPAALRRSRRPQGHRSSSSSFSSSRLLPLPCASLRAASTSPPRPSSRSRRQRISQKAPLRGPSLSTPRPWHSPAPAPPSPPAPRSAPRALQPRLRRRGRSPRPGR